tara:strand:+ start:463 stop:840 length:378 start_codon:yes stop_codon:yes gene_type:complete
MVKKSRSFPIINRDNGDLDKCIECGDQLKNVRHIRTKRKLCPMCRGDRTSENTKVREIFKEMQSNPTEPSEDEMWFEDDPRACKEQDHQRYFSKVKDVSFGGSVLSDIMSVSDTNKYRNKKEQNQ